jgi:hypothetical protein
LLVERTPFVTRVQPDIRESAFEERPDKTNGVHLIAGVLVPLVVGGFFFIGCTQQQPASQQPSTQANKEPDEGGVTANRPTIPPPNFRLYRPTMNEELSIVVVVSPATTDEELNSLLWHFREKVRSHRFKDLGINHPTAEGRKDYSSGSISVYRGARCAGESFSDVVGAGPCGQGSHRAAEYHWGEPRDNGEIDTDADSAGIYSADSEQYTQVFTYNS